MKQVAADSRVMSVVEIDRMSEKLKKAYNLLEVIQKGLNAVSCSVKRLNYTVILKPFLHF